MATGDRAGCSYGPQRVTCYAPLGKATQKVHTESSNSIDQLSKGKTGVKKMSSQLLRTETEGYTKPGKLQQVLLGSVQQLNQGPERKYDR